MRRIYLDHNAGTPMAPPVATIMRKAMGGAFDDLRVPVLPGATWYPLGTHSLH